VQVLPWPAFAIIPHATLSLLSFDKFVRVCCRRTCTHIGSEKGPIMVVRKVANPAPSVLTLVNPRRKGKKTMATKRRRRTRRRVHRAAAAHNPPRRRRTTTHRRRRHSVFAKRRTHNPVRHHRGRRRGRRRNPSVRGSGGEILRFAGAGLGLGIF